MYVYIYIYICIYIYRSLDPEGSGSPQIGPGRHSSHSAEPTLAAKRPTSQSVPGMKHEVGLGRAFRLFGFLRF